MINVVMQFSFLTTFGQGKVEICFHAIRFCHCIQLIQGSEEKHSRGQGTITVKYLQEMQLRQGSQNCQKRTDLFLKPGKVSHTKLQNNNRVECNSLLLPRKFSSSVIFKKPYMSHII